MLELGSLKWARGSDGFYYYSDPVAPGDVTELLIKSIYPIVEAPEGYSLKVHIAATAIQSEPEEAVEGAWGAIIRDDGTMTAP